MAGLSGVSLPSASVSIPMMPFIGGADFVRHTREEGRLGLAGLLGLLQALFEFFNLLVQGGAAAQGGHIHRIAFAAANIHIDPLTVFHMQLIGQLLCAVPRRIAFPEGAARGGVCQLGQQRRHVPPCKSSSRMPSRASISPTA